MEPARYSHFEPCGDGLGSVLHDVLIESRAVRDTKATHQQDLVCDDFPDMIDILAIPAAAVKVGNADFVRGGKPHFLQQLWTRHVEAQRLQTLRAKHCRLDSILDQRQYCKKKTKKRYNEPRPKSRPAPAART
jgi:hypothetical protein